jgi:ACS family hexuronate transporter-like MFS transporter
MSLTANQPLRPVLKWGICGLLLLATMINYMDRLTLNQTAKRVMAELEFGEDRYGKLEGYFGAAFAFGALFFGWMVDRINVRWVYPLMVMVWSLAGMASGFARDFHELVWCRIALGFFEAANWPCALRATQRLLRPEERTMGNGILQSGAAVGAIITPWIVLGSLYAFDSWRPPFWFVGVLGFFWAVLWLCIVRPEYLSLGTLATSDRKTDSDFWTAARNIASDPRFWALACVVVGINATWHFFRAWLPLYLQNVRAYTELQMIAFSSGYYVCTDLGALTAGFVTSKLIATGFSVHRGRMTVFFVCALLTLLSIPAALIGDGPLVLILLLVMGFGALGLFPNYYSFSQELSTRHQGKVTGTLGFICWAPMYFIQSGVGSWVQTTKAAFVAQGFALRDAEWQAYQPIMIIAGIPPMIGFLALLVLWRTPRTPAVVTAAVDAELLRSTPG